jgi:aminoglycoside phosphotransferase (APT) family kinase protein
MTATASQTPPWFQTGAGDALAQWLDTHGPALGAGAVSLSPLSGGTSGSVLLVQRGDGRAVLRTTAWPPRPDSVRALEREAQILRALDGSAVPHPGFLAFCADEGVLGAPFCLISFVDGWLGASSPPEPFASDPALRHQTAFAMIDGLAELAKIDPDAVGLSNFGKPDKFLERQVDRWLGLMAKHRAHPDYGDRQLPGFDEVAEWLRTNMPVTQRIAPIHGDVSFSNVMFAKDAPPRLAALIDWEIATIGDPLLDLGRSIYPFPSQDGSPGYSLAIDLAGWPTREALAARYAERTGLSVADVDYYMILSMFKLAALIEFNHVKSQSEPEGSMSHRMADFIPKLVAGAHDMTRRADAKRSASHSMEHSQ